MVKVPGESKPSCGTESAPVSMVLDFTMPAWISPWLPEAARPAPIHVYICLCGMSACVSAQVYTYPHTSVLV